MIDARWKKLLRDMHHARGRCIAIVIAIAIGVIAVGAISTGYVVISREISRNYLLTKPASFAIELQKIDAQLLATVRSRPEIAAAEARGTLFARMRVTADKWLPLTVFVAENPGRMQVSTVLPEGGIWPAPEGTVLLEREALALMQRNIGNIVVIHTRSGGEQKVRIAGTVHDPAVAPAWQEQTVYAYASPATLAAIGAPVEPATLHVLLKDAPYDAAAIEQAASSLANWLTSHGHHVHAIHIPPPGEHPHFAQMSAMAQMLLVFSVLVLILSAILTATLISGMLAQQVRQIGIMKAIGASSWQIRSLYLTLVAILGSIATVIGLPLGAAVGRQWVGSTGRKRHIDLSG